MNRGVLQSSPVQQMMATSNPSWWNINNFMARPPIMAHHLGLSHNHDHDHNHDQYYQQLLLSPSSSTTTNLLNSNSCSNNNNNDENNNNNNISINNNTNSLFQAHPYLNVNMSSTPSSSSWLDDHIDLHQHHHHHPSHLSESWSQFLIDGVCTGEEQDEILKRKMEKWEEQVVINQHTHHVTNHHQVKAEAGASASANMAGYGNSVNNLYDTVAIANHDQKFQIPASNNNSSNNNTWSSPSQIMNNNNNTTNIPTSSPQSCVSTFSGSNCNSLLDFSSSKSSTESLHANHPTHDRSSECNSTANGGGAYKKAKVQQSSTQSTFKVRKEKLGDRITALHQLVSPFGKTDTASVLLEAIGYIRFLQSQIEALSLPYLTSGAANKRQSHLVQGERNCMFPEDPGQLLNDNCLKRKGGPDQESYEEVKDLKSRGLCLVPVSCTLHVGSDNGADYWAPALGGGGFR